jgi:DNA-binding SARP family transcriptional activator
VVVVIGELEALVAENPRRERLWPADLALYRSGRQAEALEAYQQTRSVLDQLGIEPSANLQQLQKAVLTHDPRLETSQQRQLSRTTRRVAARLASERSRRGVSLADKAF